MWSPYGFAKPCWNPQNLCKVSMKPLEAPWNLHGSFVKPPSCMTFVKPPTKPIGASQILHRVSAKPLFMYKEGALQSRLCKCKVPGASWSLLYIGALWNTPISVGNLSLCMRPLYMCKAPVYRGFAKHPIYVKAPSI